VVSAIRCLPCKFDNVSNIVLYHLNNHLGERFYVESGEHLDCGPKGMLVDNNITFLPVSKLIPNDDDFYNSSIYDLAMYDEVIQLLSLDDIRVKCIKYTSCTKFNTEMKDDQGLLSMDGQSLILDNLWFQATNVAIQDMAFSILDGLSSKSVITLHVKSNNAQIRSITQTMMTKYEDISSILWLCLLFGADIEKWNYIKEYHSIKDTNGTLVGIGNHGVLETEIMLTSMLVLKSIDRTHPDLRSLEKTVNLRLFKDGKFVVSSLDDTPSLAATCWYIFYLYQHNPLTNPNNKNNSDDS